ncbi:MAG TPA: hypothetical protein VGL99_25945 [Chloroflexota bacterium]
MTNITMAAGGDVALLRKPGANLFRNGWESADVRIANANIPLEASARPYHTNGRLALQEARFRPAILDATWDAQRASEDATGRITTFSEWRQTPTRRDATDLVGGMIVATRTMRAAVICEHRNSNRRQL